jgi:hypothetical protein
LEKNTNQISEFILERLREAPSLSAIAFVSVDHDGVARVHASNFEIWNNEDVKRLLNLCAGGDKNEANH